MQWLITIPVINYLFFVRDLPGESLPPLEGPDDWNIEEGGWVEVVANFGEWPYGTNAPQTTVGRSRSDLRHYKVFNRPDDVPRDEFETTGLNWGGAYSRRAWDQFTRAGLAALLQFYEIPDTDAPEAMDNAMRSIRGAR